ncbi:MULTISPECIES: hypothetical protein [Bradyrhizobium]|uniref:hypothetical protein n=1 Tax=Bradyrhizobium brasilense TaxID=1419277 RepID=UPI001178AAEE|nr:hypothetical protein [Bradyrhizobium brasilense]
MSEKGCAIALLWFYTEVENQPEQRPADLAKLMHDLSLRGAVNSSRLGSQLRDDRNIIRGKLAGTVKLRLAAIPQLSTKYAVLAGSVPKPKIDDHLLPADIVEGTRQYLQSLVQQINGSYHFGFYDACAVLSRRLEECLLILAFEAAGAREAIQDAKGDYVTLEKIIAQVSATRHVKLARGAAATLMKIKELGDTAAHHPTYVTRQRDIDEQRVPFAKVISELVHLAKLKPEAG